jgi:hypothetical protein
MIPPSASERGGRWRTEWQSSERGEGFCPSCRRLHKECLPCQANQRTDSIVAIRCVALSCDDRTLGGAVPLWRLVCRMRCRECGAMPARGDMLHGVDEARSVRAMRTIRLI